MVKADIFICVNIIVASLRSQLQNFSAFKQSHQTVHVSSKCALFLTTEFSLFFSFYHSFNSPIQLQPGDEIRVDCMYQSTDKNTTTYYGEGTSDEMCFGFITYYPANDDFSYCGQWRTANVCSNMPVQCDITVFNELSTSIMAACKLDSCSNTCKYIMIAAVQTGCTTGDIGQFLMSISPQGMSYVFSLLNVCGISTTSMNTTTPATTPSQEVNGGITSMEMRRGTSIAISSLAIATSLLLIAGK